ncbi:hypothetical protein EU527_17425 [Candidatus Thorarchaeota archaeon]|nr:MAG: hypothetical protein EU527_17425 [Candidatus Thorarchaeota archaeon]
MKNVIVFSTILMVSLLILGGAQPTMAHSPSNIDLAYVYDTQTLLVEIQHDVSNVNTHYIERIEVSVNSVLNQSRDYTNQQNLIGMSDSFVVPAEIGDVISVRAICSVSGQLTETLTLTGPETSTTTTTTTTQTSTSTTTDTSPTVLDTMTLLLIGGAVVIIVVIAIVIVQRR